MSRNESDTSSLSKNWELNQYELNRIPHEIIHDDTEIAISPQILQNELLCPICLDILKKTMTTKECLHRFCQECIITALRSGNKECPTCRKKLASKRSLRPDPNFDGIIAKIYPNREEYDAMHERVLEKLKFKKVLSNINHKSVSRQSRLINKNSEEGTSSNRVEDEDNSMDIDHQMPVTSSKATKSSKRVVYSERNNNHNSDAESDIESRTSTEQSSSMHTDNNLDEVEVVLKPHPFKEFNLTIKRFIKTTSNATVTHLSKYLWTRFNLEPISQASSPLSPSSSKSSNNQNGGRATTSSASQPTGNNSNSEISDFQIFFSLNEAKSSNFQLLNQDFTLDQVIDKHWKQDRALELFYFNQKNNQQIAAGTSKADENSNSHPEPNSTNGSMSSSSSTTSNKNT